MFASGLYRMTSFHDPVEGFHHSFAAFEVELDPIGIRFVNDLGGHNFHRDGRTDGLGKIPRLLPGPGKHGVQSFKTVALQKFLCIELSQVGLPLGEALRNDL